MTGSLNNMVLGIDWGISPTNNSRRYTATSSLIGWSYTQNELRVYFYHAFYHLLQPIQNFLRTLNNLNHDFKRKQPCIGGMEMVSLSCNRVFISAEYGLGWCKIATATMWYQFHTTDKCDFLFMPWITDLYTFVRLSRKSLRFQWWQLSVTYTQYDMPPWAKIARDISRADLEWLPCDQHAPQCAE